MKNRQRPCSGTKPKLCLSKSKIAAKTPIRNPESFKFYKVKAISPCKL
jgi:hypothetical protein